MLPSSGSMAAGLQRINLSVQRYRTWVKEQVYAADILRADARRRLGMGDQAGPVVCAQRRSGWRLDRGVFAGAERLLHARCGAPERRCPDYGPAVACQKHATEVR